MSTTTRRAAVRGAAASGGAFMVGACAMGGAQPAKTPRKEVTLDYWSRFGGTGTNGEMAEFEKKRLALF